MKKLGLTLLAITVTMLLAICLFSCDGSDEDDDDDDDWWGDDDNDLDDFEKALPDPDDIKVALPSNGGDKGLGDLATLYQDTVQFTTEVNENVLMFLSWIDEITSYPPSEAIENGYIWGPWEAGGLYGGEYRFVMTRIDEGSFQYSMDGRRKNTEDEWQAVWYGNVDVSEAETERRGIGGYTVDFDAAASVEPWMVQEGECVVTYDTITDGREIDIEYIGFKPDDDDYQDYVDGLYEYHNHADNSGEFLFDVLADLHYEEYEGEEYELREHFWFNTRWQGNGSGRCDVRVTDGDLPDIEIGGIAVEEYILGECWGDDFLRDYYSELVILENGDEIVPEGMPEGEENDCVFEQQLPEVD